MGNIFNNNRHDIRLQINYDEYWDFFLNKEWYNHSDFSGNKLHDKCLIAYIDTDFFECIGDNWLYSTNSYQWESGVSIGYTLYNVGYTGVDNGLIQFNKDKISNKDFPKIFSESEFSFEEDDLRLKLHAVSGNTMKYEYPLRIENNLVRLNGGFYQGVFKTECDKYQILPSSVYNDVWDFEFVLKKEEFEKESEKTLNDSHPNNKGFFFYLGTRAENKWCFLYDKKLSGETITTDNEIDFQGMDCEPSTFYNVDWYDDLEEWRIEEEEKKKIIDIDDYINYRYYPNQILVEYDDYNEYFDEDYIDDTFAKPLPLKLDKNKYFEDLKDCCKDFYYCGGEEKQKKKTTIMTKILCCGCGKCRQLKTEVVSFVKGEPKCCSDKYLFDEYVGGLDDEFNWFGDTEYVEPEIDISNFDYQTAKYGLSIDNSNRYKTIYSDNKFLLFHRGKDCVTIGNWVEDTIVEYRQVRNNFKGNLFLLMNRTCTGYTVQTIDDLKEQYNEKYNLYEDIYNNALGFRITDNGEIGYRYVSVDCEISGDNKIKIYEGYSKPNIISESKWHVIHVKLFGGRKTMYLQFYVDGKLKYTTAEMPLLNLRKLIEEDEKQELVPFNLSLGGGTQGLCDMILPNYMKQYNTVLPIEEYFAGTFIGWMKIFRWYNCTMELINIRNNFNFEMNNLKKK